MLNRRRICQFLIMYGNIACTPKVRGKVARQAPSIRKVHGKVDHEFHGGSLFSQGQGKPGYLYTCSNVSCLYFRVLDRLGHLFALCFLLFLINKSITRTGNILLPADIIRKCFTYMYFMLPIQCFLSEGKLFTDVFFKM
jgi:hypothetical protein